MFPVLIDAGWQSGAVGFTTANGSDVIGAVEKLTAWIMKVSLGAVGNDLSRYEIWSSNRICLRGYTVHIVFCYFNFQGVSFSLLLARNFHGRQTMTLLNGRSLLGMPSKMAQKRTRYALWKFGCSRKGAKKCVMFLTWQMHCLAWRHWAWQCVWLPGHLLGLCVSIAMPRAASIVFLQHEHCSGEYPPNDNYA